MTNDNWGNDSDVVYRTAGDDLLGGYGESQPAPNQLTFQDDGGGDADTQFVLLAQPQTFAAVSGRSFAAPVIVNIAPPG